MIFPPCLPAGERPCHKSAIADGPVTISLKDRRTGEPDRPCANCGNPFAPTERRKLLCLPCHRDPDRCSGIGDLGLRAGGARILDV